MPNLIEHPVWEDKFKRDPHATLQKEELPRCS